MFLSTIEAEKNSIVEADPLWSPRLAIEAFIVFFPRFDALENTVDSLLLVVPSHIQVFFPLKEKLVELLHWFFLVTCYRLNYDFRYIEESILGELEGLKYGWIGL